MQSIRLNLAGVLAGAAFLVACSSPAGPKPPPPPPAQNVAPSITQIAVSQSGYRTARLTAAASDPDGQVAAGTVDWGDGASQPITGAYSAITMTHQYNTAQAYTVTLRVQDNAGAAAQQSRSVSITVPPELCLGILVIELCARSTTNLTRVDMYAKAGDVVLASVTLNLSNPSVPIPLALGFGQLVVSHNFVTGRTTITGEVCTIPVVACQPIATQTIQLGG